LPRLDGVALQVRVKRLPAVAVVDDDHVPVLRVIGAHGGDIAGVRGEHWRAGARRDVDRLVVGAVALRENSGDRPLQRAASASALRRHGRIRQEGQTARRGCLLPRGRHPTRDDQPLAGREDGILSKAIPRIIADDVSRDSVTGRDTLQSFPRRDLVIDAIHWQDQQFLSSTQGIGVATERRVRGEYGLHLQPEPCRYACQRIPLLDDVSHCHEALAEVSGRGGKHSANAAARPGARHGPDVPLAAPGDGLGSHCRTGTVGHSSPFRLGDASG